MHYKHCIISDTHLLSRKTEAEYLRHFLKNNTFDKLYLLGDIVDLWRISSLGMIPAAAATEHLRCFQQILKHLKNGTQVYYIYGNHDRGIRDFLAEGTQFGNLQFVDDLVVDIEGAKTLLVHGDQFDTSAIASPLVGKWGDFIYETLIVVNRWFNKTFSTKFSLAHFCKKHFKWATQIISGYERAAVLYAYNRGCDIIICGHIHVPADKMLRVKDRDVRYINSGCWTDSATCNAVYNNEDGNGWKLL